MDKTKTKRAKKKRAALLTKPYEASPANWGAKKGETIRGGLKRGAGGQFSGSGASSASTPNDAPDPAGEIEKYLDRSEMTGLQDVIAGKKVDAKTLDRLMSLGLVTDSGNASSMGKKLATALKGKDWETALTYAKKAKENADGKAKPAAGSSQSTTSKGGGSKPAGQKLPASTKAALLKVSKGQPVGDAAAELVTLGLIDKNGKLTAKGRKALSSESYTGSRSIRMTLMTEALTKNVAGVAHPASDWLVVEDPEKTTTWHLCVKTNGKPDHKLMGAAWAALTSNHRGKSYQGPNKAKALSKLKGMYDSEGIPTPAAESDEYADDDLLMEVLGEMDYAESPYVPWGAHSFADVIQAKQAQEASRQLSGIAAMFPQLVCNIINDPMVEDKAGDIKALADEFVGLVNEVLGQMQSDEDPTEDLAGDDMTDERDQFAEQMIAGATAFTEVDPQTVSDEIVEQVTGERRPTHAFVFIEAIKPGWGNKRDNNYYPAEVLAKDDTRKKFIGAKMYETDHDDSKRSTATWVSTIIEDKGVGKTGSPTFKVAIHDPNFAERMRNLEKLGLLHMMECSIQGYGQGRPGFEADGRKGRLIESFAEIFHVDWVTRAGAGGHAVGMAESDTGEVTMTDKKDNDQKVTENQPVATPIAEGEQPAEKPTPEKTPEATTPAPQPELDAKTVADELAKVNLPEVSKKRLGEGKYPDLPALQTAITGETAYVKELTGSGKVTNMGEAAPAPTGVAALQEADKAKSEINKRFFG